MVKSAKENQIALEKEDALQEKDLSLLSAPLETTENPSNEGDLSLNNDNITMESDENGEEISEITETIAENNENNGTKQDNKFVSFFKSKFKKKSTAGRIWEIDFLRGLCVFLMLFDHIAIMLATEFGPAWYGYVGMSTSTEFGAKLCSLFLWYFRDSALRKIGHPIVLFIFFSISGISCSFSKSNLKRGIILAVVSVIYSLVTYVLSITMDPGLLVTFGVLHFYAVCILTWAIICKLCKENKIAKMIVSGFIVILVAVLYFCYKAPATTPKWLFWIWPKENFDGTPSLFYQQWKVSPGDLFTLVPYASFFFAGTLLQPLLYSKRRSLFPKLDRGWHRPITFLGRHAIGVYLTHIVLVAVILCLVSYAFYGIWGLF